jgi:hypothetical protein
MRLTIIPAIVRQPGGHGLFVLFVFLKLFLDRRSFCLWDNCIGLEGHDHDDESIGCRMSDVGSECEKSLSFVYD